MGIHRNKKYVITDENGDSNTAVERDVGDDGRYRFWIRQEDGNLILLNIDEARDVITCLQELTEDV